MNHKLTGTYLFRILKQRERQHLWTQNMCVAERESKRVIIILCFRCPPGTGDDDKNESSAANHVAEQQTRDTKSFLTWHFFTFLLLMWVSSSSSSGLSRGRESDSFLPPTNKCTNGVFYYNCRSAILVLYDRPRSEPSITEEDGYNSPAFHN